ncbi:olfactory receptor 6N2 isoform X1 [Takifugu rubripes]|uniref:olfactory receptor 6N2 isoform X1 n=1 Tax=Takifugu rubripes TaxID=31033 RepID=UPI001145273A|nr:olfactory receptor 6N2 isoform X1 [Takifugu rubripes]
MQKYRYLYFVIMLSAFVTILYSNGTVVYVIYAHENLHQPMYVFIAALLVNSLLYSTAVYPKLLVDSLSDRQVITYPVCLFQWFMFYSFGGSEFLLLAVMAYDRYLAICKPLQYSAIMRRRTVGIFLAVSWFLPFCCNAAAVALSARQKLCRFSINGILCSSTVHSLHCQDSNHTLRVAMSAYGLVLLFHLVVLSLVLILFSYIRILLVSYQSSKENHTVNHDFPGHHVSPSLQPFCVRPENEGDFQTPERSLPSRTTTECICVASSCQRFIFAVWIPCLTGFIFTSFSFYQSKSNV